jgi:hypothetical protein
MGIDILKFLAFSLCLTNEEIVIGLVFIAIVDRLLAKFETLYTL